MIEEKARGYSEDEGKIIEPSNTGEYRFSSLWQREDGRDLGNYLPGNT
jgi:hypothetical protein